MPGSPLGVQKEDPTIADLLKPLGYATAQVGKNHLGDRNDDMTDLLSGKGPGQRKEIFYFDDSGSLNALRYGDWKVTFATKDSWWADVAKPRTVPLVVNLRQDPFEVTPDSKMYDRWYGDKLWAMVPAQAILGQFLMSFKEFPQRQKSTSFNIERVLDQMRARTD